MVSKRVEPSESAPTLADALGEVFPDGTVARLLKVSTSLRFSVPLLQRVDAIAKAKSITRTETIERILAWALDSLEPDRESLANVIQDRRRRPEPSAQGGTATRRQRKA
jgi:hypothetical protein